MYAVYPTSHTNGPSEIQQMNAMCGRKMPPAERPQVTQEDGFAGSSLVVPMRNELRLVCCGISPPSEVATLTLLCHDDCVTNLPSRSMRSNGSGGVGVRQGGGWNVSHRAGNAKRRRPSSPPPPRRPRLRAIPHCLHMALLPHNPSLAAPALIAIQCCELCSRIPLSAMLCLQPAQSGPCMQGGW